MNIKIRLEKKNTSDCDTNPGLSEMYPVDPPGVAGFFGVTSLMAVIAMLPIFWGIDAILSVQEASGFLTGTSTSDSL